MNKVMKAEDLVLCLAVELAVEPSLLVETIREEEDLLRVIRSYGRGDLAYSSVLDTVKDFF